MRLLLTELSARLAAHHPDPEDPRHRPFLTPPLTPAAVLLPLFEKQGETHLLLTERTHKVSHHKGQISFPGGKQDPEDPDLWATALRETFEEVGVAPEHVTHVGQLPALPTITRFCITPYVGWIPYPYTFVPSPDEIETLIEVPLSHLRDPFYRRIDEREVFGHRIPVYYYQYQSFTIWGVTGQLLFDFLNVLDA